MPLVEHDDVIEAFPSNRPDDALGEGILPRGARGDEDLAHPQAFHPPCEHVAVEGIPIAEQVRGRRLFREALDQLVGGPGGVGWSVTLTMDEFSTVMSKDQEPEEQTEGKRGDNEKSTATTSRICASRKARHVADGRGEGRRMYLATVSSATSEPRNRSSAWIRRRPQVGFSRAMRRISVRSSRSSGGRPAERRPDFQRQ
jgi:hypothetical protein